MNKFYQFWYMSIVCLLLTSYQCLVISLALPKASASFSLPKAWKDMQNQFSNSWKEMSLQASKQPTLEDTINETNVETLIADGPIVVSEREYIINGWRWHTQAVARDLQRFITVIRSVKESNVPMTPKSVKLLRQCYDFVFGFNWKGLLRVEGEIFIPWLESLLPSTTKSLFSQIYQKQASIRSLTTQISDLCVSLEKASAKDDIAINKQEVNSILTQMEKILTELSTCAKDIQFIQETVFVPYIAAYVSVKDQDKFNRMVISKLGILESQIHLVSMAEAIQETPKEMKLFQSQIPKVARLLIPVWRNRFYNPRTACLQGLINPPLEV